MKNKEKTPFEEWENKRLTLSYLHTWGCLAKVNIPIAKKHKLGPKTVDCIFLGYAFHSVGYWSVPSFEVTKCDTNFSPRRLITHLLHQMVHYRTNHRGSGYWSATITRDNISTTSQTRMSTKSKIYSESCAVRSFLWRPWTTGKVGCRTITYSTSSGTKSGSSSEAKP